MKADVYNKIIETCEHGMQEIKKCKKTEDVILFNITVFMVIIGICTGAKESEKGGE